MSPQRQRTRPYTPKRGDVCRFDLEPAGAPQEFGKYRPCLVISASAWNKDGLTCVVLPITTKDEKPSPFLIRVPEGLVDATTEEPLTGSVACGSPKTLAYRRRSCRFCCRIEDESYLSAVIDTLLDVIDPA